jgi:hypothetical protein
MLKWITFCKLKTTIQMQCVHKELCRTKRLEVIIAEK